MERRTQGVLAALGVGLFEELRRTIKAHEGDPIAIQAVLDRYAGYIRYFSKMNGYYNSDMEDYIRTKLIESLFKFRLDR